MKKTGMKVLAGTLAIALTIAVVPAPGAQAAKKVALDKKKLTITVGKSKKLKLKNNKKKVTWKITSGKKCVKLKSKKNTGVTIVAKAKGTAKVQAKIGKKKYTCKVTVKAAQKTTVATKNPVATVVPTVVPTPTPTPTATPTATPVVTPSPEPTGDPDDDLNAKDEKALQALIASLKEAGATVSEDIQDTTQYEWYEGDLVAIDWSSNAGAVISGELKLPEFVFLLDLSVAGTDITALDVSTCSTLEDIDCSNCANLTSLNVSGCGELMSLACNDTALTSLDLSGCPYMDEDSVIGADDMEITWWVPSEEDVAALENLLASLRENNNLSEENAETIAVRDKNGELNEDCYTWDASGHLSEIFWYELGLQGEISLTEFADLMYVDIYENAITSLDLSGCNKLESLDCNSQLDDTAKPTLTSLNLTGCSSLAYLDCSDCMPEGTTLDISDCVLLDTENRDVFIYDDGVEIITAKGDLDGDDFDI